MLKLLLLTVVLVTASAVQAQGVGDSLIVNLKNGQREAIPLSSIQKITFDTILSSRVQASEKVTAGLNVKDNYPNPFHSQTNIVFTVPLPGSATVNISDANGKLIRNIEKIDCNLGQNTVPWDGKDQMGNQVPMGAYFYEIHFGNQTQARRAVVVQ